MSALEQEQEQEQDQEQDQENTCMVCKERIIEVSQTVLDCGHKAHLRCFILHFGSHIYLDIPSSCVSCERLIMNTEIHDELFARVNELEIMRRNQTTTENTITNLIESSEEFNKDIIVLQKKRTALNTTIRTFNATLTEHHTAFKTKIKDVMTVLKGTHKDSVKKLTQTEEYKNARKASTSFKLILRKMCKKYDIAQRILYNHFHGNGNRFYRSSWWRDTHLKYKIDRRFKIRIY